MCFFFPDLFSILCSRGKKSSMLYGGIPDIEKSKILILCGKENVKSYIYIIYKGIAFIGDKHTHLRLVHEAL